MGILSTIAGLIPGVTRIIEKSVTDKDLAVKLESEIRNLIVHAESQAMREQAKVIVAEAQGESEIQRNWRPITMLTFVFIIANNYIIVPYAVAMGAPVPMLDIPGGMWSLLTVGIGGYIGGRSFEKIAKIKADDK